jgi:tRNA(Arg) A34 adenosine deaminase TadA
MTHIEWCEGIATRTCCPQCSAAPIVTSLEALVYSARPTLDARSVVKIVQQGCDNIGKQGYNIHTGYGRVNFGKTLKLAKAWEGRAGEK